MADASSVSRKTRVMYERAFFTLGQFGDGGKVEIPMDSRIAYCESSGTRSSSDSSFISVFPFANRRASVPTNPPYRSLPFALAAA